MNSHSLTALSLALLLACFVALTLAGPIYYQKPSPGRAALRPYTPAGCTYRSARYEHGEQVKTSEPCLNCTCKRGVLLCFLRVCPTLAPTPVDQQCETTKEPGQCCPTVRCDLPTTTTTTVLPPTTTAATSDILGVEQADTVAPAAAGPDGSGATAQPAAMALAELNNGTAGFQIVETTTDYIIFTTSAEPALIRSVVVPEIAYRHSDDIGADGLSPMIREQPASLDLAEELAASSAEGEAVPIYSNNQLYPVSNESDDTVSSAVASGSGSDPAVAVSASTTAAASTFDVVEAQPTAASLIAAAVADNAPNLIQARTEPPAEESAELQTTISITKLQPSTTTPTPTTTVTSSNDGASSYDAHTLVDAAEHNEHSAASQGAKELPVPALTANEPHGVVTDKTTSTPAESTTSPPPSTAQVSSSTQPDLTTRPTSTTSQPSTTAAAATAATAVREPVTPSSITTRRPITTSTSTTTTASSTPASEPDLVENSVKIQPNKLYASWSNSSAADDGDEESRDRVDAILDGIIHALDRRLTAELDAEPRDRLLNGGSGSNGQQAPTSSSTTTTTTANPITPAGGPLIRRKPISSRREDFDSFQMPASVATGFVTNVGSRLGQGAPSPASVGVKVSSMIGFNNKAPASGNSHGTSGSFLVTAEDEPEAGGYRKGSVIDDSDAAGIEIITAKTPFLTEPKLTANGNSDPNSFLVNLSPPSLSFGSNGGGQRQPVAAPPMAKPVQHFVPPQPVSVPQWQRDRNQPPQPPPSVNFPKPTFFQSSNQWKVVSQNSRPLPPKNLVVTTARPSTGGDNLYYRPPSTPDLTRRTGILVPPPSGAGEVTLPPALDKRPRVDEEELAAPGQASFVPYVPGGSQHLPNNVRIVSSYLPANNQQQGLLKKNGSFSIRLPISANNTAIRPLQTTSCHSYGIEYPNGAMIPKGDPCLLCRCFFSRELCQTQKCLPPPAPEKNCRVEPMAHQCCPRYICPINPDETVSTGSTAVHSGESTPGSTTAVRHQPQYPVKPSYALADPDRSDQYAPSVAVGGGSAPPLLNKFEPEPEMHAAGGGGGGKVDRMPGIPGFPAVPSHVHGPQSRYPAFPLDPSKPVAPNLNNLPEQHQQSVGNANHLVHFPAQSGPLGDRPASDHAAALPPSQFGSMPPRSDAITPLIPPRPQPGPGLLMTGSSNAYQPGNRIPPQGPMPFNRIPIQNIAAGPGGRPWSAANQPPPYMPMRPPPSVAGVTTGAAGGIMPPPASVIPNASPIDNSVGTYTASAAKPPSQPITTIGSSTSISFITTPITSSSSTSTSIATTSTTTPMPQTSSSTTTAQPTTTAAKVDLEKELLESIMNAVSAVTDKVKWPSSDSNDSTLQSVQSNPQPQFVVPSSAADGTTGKPVWKASTTKPQQHASTPSSSVTAAGSSTAPASSTTSTTTSTPARNPWDLLRVSGCNIYGKVFQVDETIPELSTDCKKCFCSTFGVQCSKIC